MPTYEYICQKCGHQFEKVQSIAAGSLRVCPKEDCRRKPWGKGKVKRVSSGGAGLLFKGSGFYITDYRSEKYKEAARKDSSAASSAGGEKKTSGSESKAAAKPPGGKAEPAKK